MKLFCAVLIGLVLFSGCSKTPEEVNQGLALRSALLQAQGCRFSADIAADYGDTLHMFSMDCQADQDGSLTFQVTAPESICGITGEVEEERGRLTFDGKGLYFSLLADGQLSPVSAPWILMRTLRSGYLRSAGREGDLLHLTMEDGYEDRALTLDIWVDEMPVRAEILFDGMRILTMDVKDFQILQHSEENSIG